MRMPGHWPHRRRSSCRQSKTCEIDGFLVQRLAAEESVTALTPIAVARDVHLRVAGVAAIVNGDPDRLRELVSNLVLNAVPYNSPGGAVTCSISIANSFARLEVAATGSGIDPRDLPHIFERFYRTNKERSRAAGGTGLGLAISKWIVDSHGGQFDARANRARAAVLPSTSQRSL